MNGPPLHHPAARRPRKESTKSWVHRAFYSTAPDIAGKSNTSSSPPPNYYKSDQLKRPERKKEKVESTPFDESEEPSIRFLKLDIEEGAETFKFCLVGKFPRWRPSLEMIRNWARKEWKLRGGWSITLLDRSHVFIRLDNEEDMIKVWPRSRWFVGGNPMKVFEWVPTFRGDVDAEPSTAAVWISLPTLPVVLFQEQFLYQVAGLVEKVVTMDRPTKNLSRTNVARVCVEVDLTQKLPNRVKIEIGDYEFLQDVVYEKLPYYCTHCNKQGHSTNICKFSRLLDEKIDDVDQVKTDVMTVIGNQTLPNAYVDLQAQTCPDILNMSGRKKRATITEAASDNTAGSRKKKREGKSVEGGEKSNKQGNMFDGTISKGRKRSMFDGTSKGRKSGTGCALEHEVIGTSVIGIMHNLLSATAIYRKRAMFENVEKESDDESRKVQSQALQRNDHLSVTNTNMKSTAARKNFKLRSVLFFWKRKDKALDNFCSSPNYFANLTTKRFTLAEIKRATGNFDSSRLIGGGGFGLVFRGIIDGIEVAVKRHRTISATQGRPEFEAEVVLLSRLSHKNLVQLIGYCIDTEVAGTLGYLDPRYFLTGRATTQSDVYSFGVVLFELLCGKPAFFDNTDIVRWAQSFVDDGNVEGIVDPRTLNELYSHLVHT